MRYVSSKVLLTDTLFFIAQGVMIATGAVLRAFILVWEKDCFKLYTDGVELLCAVSKKVR
jgi:hypothetical protein